RIPKTGGPERHIGRMAGHVAQGPGAKIEPTSPVERMINFLLVWAHRCRSQPQIPFEVRRHGVLPWRPANTLRPNWAVAPHIDLPTRTDEPSLNHFHRAAKTVFRAALIAHLCHRLVLPGQLPQMPGFKDRLRQWLLTINMFVQLEGSRSYNRMQVVGRRNHDRVDVFLLLFQHFAPVEIKLRAWATFQRSSRSVLVRIGNRDELLS